MVDLKTLSTAELHTKMAEIKEICLKNCDLSAHLLDLKIREMQDIHEELECRKSEITTQVMAILAKLDMQIVTDAYANRMEMAPKHYKAKDFVDNMRSRALHSQGYALSLILWYREGKTSVLRDNLLRPLLYNNDNMTHFNAFTLLDDCGIKLREKEKEVVNG